MVAHTDDAKPDRPGEPIRVLLVDDAQWVRNAIATILNEERGVEVVAVASNGREALEMVRSTSFDLVIMDVQMPVMDGIEATQAIKREPCPPVVLMTSVARRADLPQLAATARADAWCDKISLCDDIFGIIESLFSTRRP